MIKKITWAMVKNSPRGAIDFLVESNRIEGIGDEDSSARYARTFQGNMTSYETHGLSREEYNSMRALKFVVQHFHEDLTVEKILKLHAIQMKGTMPIPEGKKRRFKAGVFRDRPVYVNRKEKPLCRKVPTLMHEFVEDFNDKKRGLYSDSVALRMHYQFECIHPFMDGNGRVGRLLWLWDVLRHDGGIRSILDNFQQDPHSTGKTLYYIERDNFRRMDSTDKAENHFSTKRKRYYDAIGEYEREEGWVQQDKETTLDRYAQEALLYIEENSTSRRQK